MKNIKVFSNAKPKELERRENFVYKLRETPIPDTEILQNLGVYLTRQNLSRVLFMSEIYQKIVPVHGVVMEFGVRWGQNMSLFSNLRGIYEPYNYNRKIIGFDTFEGFPSVDAKDGDLVKVNDYAVTENYSEYLSGVLDYHEKESPISHLKKYELVVGDASKKIIQYLDENPHTIIALSYFDFDIYEPTKNCLLAIKDRLTKGSVIVFDELNYSKFPGETIALMEAYGLGRYAIRRSTLNPLISYIVVD